MLVGIKNCPFGKDFGNNNVQKFYDMLLFCKKEEEVRKYIVLCLFNFFGKEQRGMEVGGGRKGKKEERAERGREEKDQGKGFVHCLLPSGVICVCVCECMYICIYVFKHICMYLFMCFPVWDFFK